MWAVDKAEQATKHPIFFKDHEYMLPSKSMDDLSSIASKAKSDQQITILMPTGELVHTSILYIIEKTRALMIFKGLVSKGVDPANIKIQKVTSTGKSSNVIELTLQSLVAADKHGKTEAKNSDKVQDLREIRFKFGTGLAEPLDFSQEEINSFIKAAGQNGCEQVKIEGYADVVGPNFYNQALGHLRALRVYEILARSGGLPCEVQTVSMGSKEAKRGSEILGGNQDDRKVLVTRVGQNKVVVVETREEEAVPKPWPKFGFDLVPYVGILQPGGELKDNAKAGLTYGLGVGKALWSDETEGRITLFASGKSKLEPKQSDRSGTLTLNQVNLRFDYAHGAVTDRARVFVGAGVGYVTWQGEIGQPSSGRENTDKNFDPSVLTAVGVDVRMRDDLFLAPELTWQSVSGDFNEQLFNAYLSLRWRI